MATRPGLEPGQAAPKAAVLPITLPGTARQKKATWASTRAAVHGMTMIVGEQVIEARIKERQVAQNEFDQAKKQGKNQVISELDLAVEDVVMAGPVS